MTILINRKTRQPLVINNEQELTCELKKASKNFKQINDLNRHLFACLHLESFPNPPAFYKKLKEILGCSGSGTKVNKEILISNYGWTAEEAEDWDLLFRTRTDRHLEKTGKDRDLFHKQNTQFSVEFWKKKGLSEEEAKIKVSLAQAEMSSRITTEQRLKNSHVSLHYSGYEGFTDEEKKTVIAKKQAEYSPRRKEYWVKEGFTEEEAKLQVSLYQKLWMGNKTPEELAEINKKKGESVLNYRTLWTDKYDIPGILYLIDIGNSLYKIGITTKESVSGKRGRYSERDMNHAELILNIKLDKISAAFCIEQLVLRHFKNHRVIKNHGPFGKFEVIRHDKNLIINAIAAHIAKTPELLKEELFSLINKEK